MAEDKCVIGEETFFLPVVAQCPVLAPWGMLISFVPPAFGPNEAVMFTLKQYQVRPWLSLHGQLVHGHVWYVR